jgi:hypothetical protein
MHNALTPAALETLWNAIDAAAVEADRGNPTMRFERAERLARAVVIGNELVVEARFGTKGRRESVRVVREVLLRG